MTEHTEQERALINRMFWRLLPILCLCYITAVIDRSNIGFAKLQMVGALHMTEVGYGFGASLYFIGYVLFEIPSTLGMRRFGARFWFPRILLTWGLVTVLLGFSFSQPVFFILRFLLGVAEAGLYTSCIYYITAWFPQQDRARGFGFLQMGGSVGNVLAALFAGPVLDMSGTLGLAGWQWVFILTGIPPLLTALIVSLYLPSHPSDARFLSEKEKFWITRAVTVDKPRDYANPLTVLWEKRVLLLACVSILHLTSLYGMTYWLPTVIKSFGVTGTQNGLLSATPWFVTACVLIVAPVRWKEQQSLLHAFSVIAVIGLVAFLTATFVSSHTLRFLALLVGVPCMQLLAPCLWALVSYILLQSANPLTGARAAAGLSAINLLASLGGLLAQTLMPWVGGVFGNPVYSMLVPAVCMGILAFVPIAMRKGMDDGAMPSHENIRQVARAKR